MGVASGCGEQEEGVASGSGWNLWVWLLGVVVRRYRIAGNFRGGANFRDYPASHEIFHPQNFSTHEFSVGYCVSGFGSHEI